MADLYLERIGLARPTIVKRDNDGEIERLESVGLDIASLVDFWKRCFDLNGLLFEKITLHCKSKDFNAMGQRTLATCRSVRELLAEQGVECVIDDEWFKNHQVKNEAEFEAEIERLRADNEALKMWNNAYMEENKKLKSEKHKLKNDLADFDEFARDISKTRIEITGEAIPTCKTLLEYIKKEKRNAVEKFAGKLKEEVVCNLSCKRTAINNTEEMRACMTMARQLLYRINRLLNEDYGFDKPLCASDQFKVEPELIKKYKIDELFKEVFGNDEE